VGRWVIGQVGARSQKAYLQRDLLLNDSHSFEVAVGFQNQSEYGIALLEMEAQNGRSQTEGLGDYYLQICLIPKMWHLEKDLEHI
jgi:hypothetical protein